MSRDRIPTNHEIQPSAEASLRIDKALEVYNGHYTGVPLQRRTDVGDVFADYTSRHIQSAARDAAELCDVFDRLNDTVTETNALRALTVFRRDTVPLDNSQYTHGQYITSIANDFPVVNNFVSNQIDLWRHKLAQDGETDLAQALNAPNHHVVPQSTWLKDPISPDAEALLMLAEDIQLETFAVKAAQTIAGLRSGEYRSRMSDTDLMRTIVSAEAVYAPVCEWIGAPELASALTDEAWAIRLEKAGRTDVIEKAREIRDSAVTPDNLVELFPEIITQLYGHYAEDTPVQNDSDVHDRFYRRGYVEIKGIGLMEYEAREKSIISIARKLLHLSGNDIVPSDIFGMYIITDNDAQTGEAFAHLVENTGEHPNIVARPAPSREQAYHIKGSAGFRSEVLQALGGLVAEEDIDIKPGTNSYEVAKMTFTYEYGIADGEDHLLPIEIQFLNQTAHEEGRYGDATHALFKMMKYGNLTPAEMHEAAGSIRELAGRRTRLDTNCLTVNGASFARGEARMRSFARTFAAKIGHELVSQA